jgi:hypothetical protein
MNTETVDKDKTLSTADFAAAAERPQEHRDTARVDAQQDTLDDRRQGIDRRQDVRESTEQLRDQPVDRRQDAHGEVEQLAALFAGDVASDFRSRWDAVQIGFVDDPKQAVRQADELVAQVMKSLAESFSNERARFESEMEQGNSASTENLRVALRRYRSFFQRLLTL